MKIGWFKGLGIFLIILPIFIMISSPSPVYAEDAQVLPKGRFSIRIRSLYTFYDKRFDPLGGKEPIGVDFDHVNADRSVFPALANLETFFGFSENSLTLGTSSFISKVEEFDYPIYIAYGLSDNVSIGMVIPILNIKRKVDFSISGGNVGFVPGTGTLLPVGVGGVTKAVDTEDVQTILKSPQFGFELEEFRGFNRTGLGDIRIGFKHRYLLYNKFRAAYSLSFRFPTGKSNDPDDLLDIPFGDGQPDIVFELHNDYLPLDRTLVNLYMRYTLQLRDHEMMRLQASADEPIVPISSKEKMKRNLGDYFETEIFLGHGITESVTLGLAYDFIYKGRDSIVSPTGKDTKSLEDETDRVGHIFKFSIGYSTLSAYLKGISVIPIDFVVEGSRVLKGRNTPSSQTIGLDIGFFF